MQYLFQVAPSDYRDIVSAVTSTLYVRCHGCFNKSPYVLPIGSAFLVMFAFMIIAIVNSALDAFVIFSLPMLGFILALLVVYTTCTLKVSIKHWDI